MLRPHEEPVLAAHGPLLLQVHGVHHHHHPDLCITRHPHNLSGLLLTMVIIVCRLRHSVSLGIYITLLVSGVFAYLAVRVELSAGSDGAGAS